MGLLQRARRHGCLKWPACDRIEIMSLVLDVAYRLTGFKPRKWERCRGLTEHNALRLDLCHLILVNHLGTKMCFLSLQHLILTNK